MFPIYLFPPAPFRRRRKGPGLSAQPPIASGAPGADCLETLASSPLLGFLRGRGSLLRCGRCAVDLCPTSAIVSRGFTGRWGRAYLVSPSARVEGPSSAANNPSLPNTHVHKPVSRQLVTGAHTVSDVSCAFCGSVLGWKYVDAEEELQKYKVGKYILETKRVSVATCWEHDDMDFVDEPDASIASVARDAAALEFDSQDEDECEDLFAGMWSPSSALKRRKAKAFGRTTQR